MKKLYFLNKKDLIKLVLDFKRYLNIMEEDDKNRFRYNTYNYFLNFCLVNKVDGFIYNNDIIDNDESFYDLISKNYSEKRLDQDLKRIKRFKEEKYEKGYDINVVLVLDDIRYLKEGIIDKRNIFKKYLFFTKNQFNEFLKNICIDYLDKEISEHIKEEYDSDRERLNDLSLVKHRVMYYYEIYFACFLLSYLIDFMRNENLHGLIIDEKVYLINDDPKNGLEKLVYEIITNMKDIYLKVFEECLENLMKEINYLINKVEQPYI